MTSKTGLVTLTLKNPISPFDGSELGSGPITIDNATGTGSFISINGTFTGYWKNASTITYNINTGLTMTISGGDARYISGRFQVGQTIYGVGVTSCATRCTIITGYVGNADGTKVGDQLTLSQSVGTISAEEIDGTIYGPLPSYKGYIDWNSQH